MRAKFDVKMTRGILFDFQLAHMYRSFSGWFSLAFGVGVLAVALTTFRKTDLTMSMLYFFCAFYALPLQPILLYLRAARQMKLNPVYKEALHYEISDEGIFSRQKGQEAHIGWDQVVKATETRRSLLLYTGKRYSFLLPKESMGGQKDTVVRLVRKHLKPRQIKIKG